MSRSLCLAFALAVAALATSMTVRPAGGATPDASQSTIGSAIVSGTTDIAIIVGGSCGPSQAGYRVVVRDANQVVLPNVEVKLDFSATPIKLFVNQQSGITVNCADKTLSMVTDAFGTVTFVPKFGKFENANLVEVRADDVLLGSVPARSTDIDGFGSQTGLADFAIFAAHYVETISVAETNWDDCPPGAAAPSLWDFAQFATQYVSAVVVGPYCP